MSQLKINTKLLTRTGFFEWYYERLFEIGDIKDADLFHILNDEFEQMFGFTKYSDFGSFRVAKHRYHKDLAKKRKNLKELKQNVTHGN